VVVISGRATVDFAVDGMSLGLPMRATHIQSGFSLCGEIGEFIAFRRELTDREMQIVNKYLMAKWGVEPFSGATVMTDARDLLPPTTALSLPAGATVDFEGAPQTLASLSLAGETAISNCDLGVGTLTYAVPQTGVVPCLTVDCDMDVTETDLVFADAKPTSGRFLKTSGTLTGPFKSVTGSTTDKIVYKPNRAQILTGLMLILR